MVGFLTLTVVALVAPARASMLTPRGLRRPLSSAWLSRRFAQTCWRRTHREAHSTTASVGDRAGACNQLRGGHRPQTPRPGRAPILVRHAGGPGTYGHPDWVTPAIAGGRRVVHADAERGIASLSAVVAVPHLLLGMIVNRDAVDPVPDLEPGHAGSRSQDTADPAPCVGRLGRLTEADCAPPPGLSRPWKPC